MQISFAKWALHNDNHNGDQCGHWCNDGKTTLCVADGLGHGKFAELAALAAVDYVSTHLNLPLAGLFSGCDREIHHSRGVAMGIAIIEEETGKLEYAGVGNIRGKVVSEKMYHLSCGFGIVGAGYKKLIVEKHTMNPGDLLILYTDGIKEMINLETYDNTLLNDVENFSRRILDDWRHSRDDAAVLVYKKE